MTEIFLAISVALSLLAVLLVAASAFMSTYTAWIYRENIPAIREHRPLPEPPWAVRVGERIAHWPKKKGEY